MSDEYLTIVIKGMPREVSSRSDVFGCPVIALSRGDATKEIEQLENIVKLFVEVDKRVIWEGLGLGNTLADRIETALYGRTGNE